MPARSSQRSVRESNPVSVLTTDVCSQNTYRPNIQVIPDGIEPSLSCMSRRRLRRWTTGSSSVTEAGIEPAKSPGSRPDRFACLRTRPQVAGPGVAPGSQAYEAPNEHWPTRSCRSRYRTGRTDRMKVSWAPVAPAMSVAKARVELACPKRARRSERRAYTSSATRLCLSASLRAPRRCALVSDPYGT